MRGVVFTGERGLELMSFPDPTPEAHDVVIEMKASGMCGNDLHQYRRPKGQTRATGIPMRDGPVIAGHEPFKIHVIQYFVWLSRRSAVATSVADFSSRSLPAYKPSGPRRSTPRRRRRGPNELAAVQALGVQRQADAIMPKNLGKIAPTPAEDIEIAGMGIALQALLYRQSQALHAPANVRVPSGDPDPDAARYRDHCWLRTSRTRPNASASTFSSTLTRLPSPSSISIRPRRFRAGVATGASIGRTLWAAAAAT
jgi:hypothetical protein